MIIFDIYIRYLTSFELPITGTGGSESRDWCTDMIIGIKVYFKGVSCVLCCYTVQASISSRKEDREMCLMTGGVLIRADSLSGTKSK